MNNTMSASGLQVLGQTLEPRQQVMDPSAITGTFNQVYRDGAPYDQIEITFTSDTTSTFSTAYFSLTADDTPWGTAAFQADNGCQGGFPGVVKFTDPTATTDPKRTVYAVVCDPGDGYQKCVMLAIYDVVSPATGAYSNHPNPLETAPTGVWLGTSPPPPPVQCS
jgi:hypothetical protein